MSSVAKPTKGTSEDRSPTILTKVLRGLSEALLGRILQGKRAEERRLRFHRVVDAIEELAKTDRHALPSLARLIAQPLQAEFAGEVLRWPAHQCSLDNDVDRLFFRDGLAITTDGKSLFDLRRSFDEVPDAARKQRFWLQLGRDAVIPAPWHRGRLVDCLSSIGRARKNGGWEADQNHRVALLLPFGLGVVHGGNHSIATGICNGEGRLISIETLDFTPAYDHVRYDGLAFRRVCDGEVLSQPKFEEPGMLFELGRKMNELGVAYDAQIASAEDVAASKQPQDAWTWAYQVWIDGHDTGANVSGSAIENAMLAAGIQRTDRRWEAILYAQHPLVRTNWKGVAEKVEFHHVLPRQEYSDLSWVSRPFQAGV